MVYKTVFVLNGRLVRGSCMNLIRFSTVERRRGIAALPIRLTIFGSLDILNKYSLKQLVMLLISSNLLACAGSSGQPESGSLADEPVSTDCISQRSVRDYKVLDEANLIVTGGANRKYHVLLGQPARGLRSSWKVGFHSASGRICSNFSDLVVEGNFGAETYRITSVRRLTPEDENELLIRFGKKEPDYEKPRQTEEVDGAEVEALD